MSNETNQAVVLISQIARSYNINLNQAKVVTTTNPYTGKITPPVTPDDPLYMSDLGTPVFGDITFESVTYTDFTTGKRITTPSLTIPIVLFNVSLASIIVKTHIDGRRGSVKEYIGLDDYQITINGILTGPNGVYPASDVSALKTIRYAPVPIPVTSTYLNNMDIHNIVIESFTLDQEAGGYSKQNFTMSAISDEPIQLQII